MVNQLLQKSLINRKLSSMRLHPNNLGLNSRLWAKVVRWDDVVFFDIPILGHSQPEGADVSRVVH